MIPTKKVSFLWENDIQIELRHIAAVLAISDNDRVKLMPLSAFNCIPSRWNDKI